MTDHMDRVRVERAEVCRRYEALRRFLTDQPRLDRLEVSKEEIARLRRQFIYMGLYIDVLDERIAAARDDDYAGGVP